MCVAVCQLCHRRRRLAYQQRLVCGRQKVMTRLGSPVEEEVSYSSMSSRLQGEDIMHEVHCLPFGRGLLVSVLASFAARV
mmetsp:Transcript_17611/g.40750  ORF Transcript_17611/g.40750 Transcript_17611/m.40750 type:complete len:80 (+) Transcript_17611:3842-4081(+)